MKHSEPAKTCPHCGKDTTIQPGMLELLERIAGHAKKAVKRGKRKKLNVR